MANYYGTARTSYFPITKEKLPAFEAYMEKLPGVHHEAGAETVDGVQTYCLINDYESGFVMVWTYDDDTEEDTEIEPIQDILEQFVTEPTAIFYVEAGAEKARYVVGQAALYTRDSAGQVTEEADMSVGNWVTRMMQDPRTDGLFQTAPEY